MSNAQPLSESQRPTVHGSPSMHTRRRPGRHPAKGTQRSAPLQRSSSAHAPSSGSNAQLSSPSSQTSLVQSISSSHGASPATQTSSTQSSKPLQKQPSPHSTAALHASPRCAPG